MSHRYHFISGLPRSGSTLLAAILKQNPRFQAGMTSPVGAFFSGLLDQVSAGSEWGPVVTTAQRRRLLRGLFDSYYAEETGKDVVFDTNRAWCGRLPALLDLFPDAKIIACVRNVAWVMDSLERLYRASPYENSRLFADDVERNTVYSRVETLAQRNRLVGFAWSALKEAFYGEQAASLLVVDYDLLARAPEKVMPLIYDFLGEPAYPHDFANLQYDAPAFDNNLGLSGLHSIRPRVTLENRATILPPDLFEQYADMAFWRDGRGSRAHVVSAQPAAARPLVTSV
ncbi:MULTISPECIES: sulfotransferase family protein [Methylomonas]|uniref:Sulfotransferase n=1 Tax=Methylomonas koyamae TaxID=702114 RepID=A0A177NPB4_9GAMM|nr:sulfotransferase [Methylomonas koyamae]OAI19173.1 sulfotransferase [Methylomonas koyamae]